MQRFAAFALASTIAIGVASNAQSPVERPRAEYPTPLEGPLEIAGPLKSAHEMQAFQVLGLKLGMQLSDARRLLEAQGFKQRHPDHKPVGDTSGEASGSIAIYWGKHPEPTTEDVRETLDRARRTGVVEATSMPSNIATLRYVMLDGKPAKLVGISYEPPFNLTRTRNVSARRDELLQTFGEPTYWRKLVTGLGLINDVAIFTAKRDIAALERLDTIAGCLIDWRHQNACYKTNCKQLLASAQTSVLKVQFGGYSTYQLIDLEAQYASLSRDPEFRSGRTADRCVFPSIH